ncbi:MAG: hypothetical protein R3E73_03945 [Porticoccaceae bacterium]|nr:hypothetical protein [Pseudomonadales bacterium]MCP5172660.1 hypothetical protein [Pseudomonadales bacterium]MCP5302134.1 hypothetical protein [Pseudomonadales bacterium]
MNQPAEKTVSPNLLPIGEENIPDVAVFLNRHMNSTFSVEAWANGLRACWLEDAPNHGFMLQAEGQIVGVLCAIYSLQNIEGRTEKFCNPHTWCVLEPYRSKSVPLVLSVIRQEGYHFTMFSPNKEGEQIFSYLGFKPLDRSKLVLPHTPSPKRFKKDEIFTHDLTQYLPPTLAKCAEDHQPYPWVHSFAFRSGDEYCLVFYKPGKYKKMPCANITYISNKSLFSRCWGAVKNHLLFKKGLLVTRIDARFLENPPRLSFKTLDGPARFYLSNTAGPADIEYIYSELTVMNL